MLLQAGRPTILSWDLVRFTGMSAPQTPTLTLHYTTEPALAEDASDLQMQCILSDFILLNVSAVIDNIEHSLLEISSVFYFSDHFF